jgi:hypothetical protein
MTGVYIILGSMALFTLVVFVLDTWARRRQRGAHKQE